jgi:cytochrome bd-type quinol oxidase subunit 2
MEKTKNVTTSSTVRAIDDFAVNFMHFILGGVSLGFYFFVLVHNLTDTIERSAWGYMIGLGVLAFAFGCIYFFKSTKKEELTKTITTSLIVNLAVGLLTIVVMVIYFAFGSRALKPMDYISFLAILFLFFYTVYVLCVFMFSKSEEEEEEEE